MLNINCIGKTGMKTKRLQKELGATAACTIRAGEATTQVKEAITLIKGDAWFGSVKAAAAAKERGMEATYQVKSNHGLFPKEHIEEALKDAPGGCSIVLEGKHPNGSELIAMGYRYNSKVTLHFVMTKNAGSTRKGSPYEMKFTDSHGNVHVRLVDRPSVISQFFQDSNVVDSHNQARQHELGLEKKWETRDPYFRLTTTMIGINTTDAWNISRHHLLFSKLQQKQHAEQAVTMLTFAGILTKQLLIKANNERPMSSDTIPRIFYNNDIHKKEEVSVMSDDSNKDPCVKFYKTTTNAKGKNYTKSRRCVNCNKFSVAYCNCCNKTYCYAVGTTKHGRTCMIDHIKEMKRNRGRKSLRNHVV